MEVETMLSVIGQAHEDRYWMFQVETRSEYLYVYDIKIERGRQWDGEEGSKGRSRMVEGNRKAGWQHTACFLPYVESRFNYRTHIGHESRRNIVVEEKDQKEKGGKTGEGIDRWI